MERYAILVENTNYHVHYCINNNPIMILITELNSLQYFELSEFLFIAFFIEIFKFKK